MTTPVRASLPAGLASAGPALRGRSALGLVLALELVLLAGLVWPLWLFHRHDAIPTPEPLATILGISWAGLLRFAVVLGLWLAAYVVAGRLARSPLTPGARRVLLFAPAAFLITLLFVLPVSSKDVYHYVMEGRVSAVYHDNPSDVPPAAYPDDPLYWVLSSWQSTPSRYGPAHNVLAAGIVAAGRGNLTAMLLGFKLVTAAALLGTAALVWLIVRRVRPELALPAYVLVAWNPLALYEAGANAHNDILMTFFAALALYCAARARLDLAFPALALGVLTKYIVILLGPVLLLSAGMLPAYAGERVNAGPWRRALVGLVAAAVLCALAYIPFWNGTKTFSAVGSASGDMLSSPGWLLRQALKHMLGWNGARPVVVALFGAAFLAGYAVLLLRVYRWSRRATDQHPPSLTPLWVACWAVLALELCTVSWWFWPWYTVWLLPAAALLADRRIATLTVVATSAGLLSYVPINFREVLWGPPTTDRMPLAEVLIIFVPPALVALRWWWERRRDREGDQAFPTPTN